MKARAASHITLAASPRAALAFCVDDFDVDEGEILGAQPLCDFRVGAIGITEFLTDMREVHAGDDQHPPLLFGEFRLERFDQTAHPGIVLRRRSIQHHLMERAHKNRHHLVTRSAERPRQK